MNTIRTVFPSCRIFREGEPPSAETVEETGRDFDNVIVFCTKTDEKVTFRKPTEADFLGSLSRRAYLFPKHEVDESSFAATAADAGILRVNETEKLAEWHDQSALGHWAVMRTVLPKHVWEQW